MPLINLKNINMIKVHNRMKKNSNFKYIIYLKLTLKEV